MEQTNMVLAMFQAMAAQGTLPKTGKAGDKAAGDFQKLLDQKSQSQQPARSDAPAQQKPKADGPAVKEEAPETEDPLEQVKKLAEQGYAMAQSALGAIPFDPNSLAIEKSETGEYVVMQLGEDGEVLSVIELDPWQQQQLQQLTHGMELMENAKDPEADAILEVTDPAADHSPAEILEKAVNYQAGKAEEQMAEQAKPQEEDDGVQVELLDVDQGPRQIFHDVKAAPIKVGEAPETEQVQNVTQQIDAGLAQALQKGESMVRIQLTPENLGEVTVELTRSAEGVLRVALTASSADTRTLLERHAGDLQSALAGRTQQSVEVNVQRQQESQQNQNQQHDYDGHNGHPQDGQERRRQQREHASSQDFMQQLRLGLIPDDGGI